jgi:integration host factor subunit alpha
MTLTKSHLINAILQQNGFTKKQSTETVETILEIIKSSLASGDDVLISGFGKFCVKVKRERKGRNPAAGWIFFRNRTQSMNSVKSTKKKEMPGIGDYLLEGRLRPKAALI